MIVQIRSQTVHSSKRESVKPVESLVLPQRVLFRAKVSSNRLGRVSYAPRCGVYAHSTLPFPSVKSVDDASELLRPGFKAW